MMHLSGGVASMHADPPGGPTDTGAASLHADHSGTKRASNGIIAGMAALSLVALAAGLGIALFL